jgi:hypothetical protein
MARIRSIKPDFWTDEKLVELEPWERLLFIGLWNFADDEGYMPYSPKRIAMQIFPGDPLEVSRGLQNLISIGALTLYRSDIGEVLKVTNWEKHQKVSNPTKSKYSQMDLTQIDPDTKNPRKLAVVAPQSSEEVESPTELSVTLHTEGEREREVLKDLSSKQDEFDQWYSGYPKKEAKEAARKAFVKARRQASMDELMSGRDRYAQAVQGKDRQFIALPATWLNAGRWADETPDPETTLPVPAGYAWANR